MANWSGRLTADLNEDEWGEWGPRVYFDGELIGTIDITALDPQFIQDDCQFEIETCTLAYHDAEGDYSVPGGWHEFIDCDPDPDDCAVLRRWVNELADGLAEPDALAKCCEDAENLDEIIESLEDSVPDQWLFPFAAENA